MLQLMVHEQTFGEDIGKQTAIVEGCRLAALILLGKIRRRFLTEVRGAGLGGKVVFTGIETYNLRYLLENNEDKWRSFLPVLLWTVVIGACETMNGEGEIAEWYYGMTKRAMEELGLTEWGEVVIMVGNLLWIGELMDADCEELGRRVNLLM